MVGLPALGAALVETVATAYGFHEVRRCRADQRVTPPEEAAPERKELLGRAWTMERAAAKAALDGDCETVVRIDAELRALDAEFADTWLVRDVAIQRCLATSVHPPAPPSENP